MFYGKIASVVVLSLSLCLFFSGCAKVASPAVFGYIPFDAEFTVVFPSEVGDVECRAERSGERIELTLVKPERSAGTQIVCSPDGCALIPAGSDGILLSEAAAERLTLIFDLMYRGDCDAVSLRKTEKDTGTVISYNDGETVVGDGMFPTEVTVYGENERSVVIRDYKLLTEEKAATT